MTSTKAIDLATTSGAYYAPAVSANSGSQIIHVSGQPGNLRNGHLPSDYESQIHLALLNLRKIIITANASVRDIVKLTVLIVNYNPFRRQHVRHIQTFLNGHRPAITLIPVTALAVPEWLFEVDAVLVRPSIERPLVKSRPRRSVDVAIIGGGLAGLTAAARVQESGLSCLVLEARDRVGGKTWSQPLPASPDDSGFVDLGAGWLNDVNQMRIYELAKRFGAEFLEQNTTGLCVLEDKDGRCSTFEYGELPKFDATVVQDIARIRDMVEADCQALDKACPQSSELDTQTFEAYLRSRGASEAAISTATVWTRAMLGQDPHDISALFFLSYCRSGGGLFQMRSDRKGGGQHLRVRQGMQLMANGLANALSQGTVQLSNPVLSVEQHLGVGLDVIDVTTESEIIRASKVITTVPSPVLKTIDFFPKLPAAKRAWAESSTYGYYTKAMMVFRSPFWVKKGYCGLVQSFTGPAGVIRDSSSLPDKKYIMTCFMGSDPGRSWSLLSTKDREEALVKQIGKLFDSPDEAASEFIEMVTYEWAKDKYSGWGCPCASLTPGVLDTIGADSLRKPCGGLHFAGTETAVEWKGYMEGAVESGERAADEVIHSLRSEIESRL
ncbi:monoamine oxidase [Fusarium oxysporum NRRL 32931]|uniref:Amine oxidase n=1 Tax=Fusarium oxysporum NRRL 32931 TaxID=660029 RepID=W9HP50_FUSOX|nr:monoamine oxidase [Fusarium oxysporum NRRL 32931]